MSDLIAELTNGTWVRYYEAGDAEPVRYLRPATGAIIEVLASGFEFNYYLQGTPDDRKVYKRFATRLEAQEYIYRVMINESRGNSFLQP